MLPWIYQVSDTENRRCAKDKDVQVPRLHGWRGAAASERAATMMRCGTGSGTLARWLVSLSNYSEDRNTIINDTVKNLCNVEAYWEYGTAVGNEDRTFKLYYGDELTKGRIGSVIDGKANAYWGTGGYEWAKKYGLNSSISGNYDTASNKYTSPVNENKVNELIKNSPVGTTLLIYKDTKNVGTGTHWVEAKIVTDGTNKVLIDYDHNRDSQGKLKEVDTSKVYKIIK